MVEWLSESCLRLIANYQILSGEAGVRCFAVDHLRLFTFTLGAVLLVRMILNFLVFYKLRKRFTRYSQDTYPDLIFLYRSVAKNMGLRRVPPLFRFLNKNPAVFTIGWLRPAVFLAPALVRGLCREELEAVLVHELTHVKRRDNLLIWLLEVLFVSLPVLIVQLFAIDFVFSGPHAEMAVWGTLLGVAFFKLFLWKRILFFRELSCDDLCVDRIRDPLVLASSLINVRRLTERMANYRWQAGVAFPQAFLSSLSFFEARVRRLIDYRRPRFKFLVGKAVRVSAVFLLMLNVLFLWQFTEAHSQVQVRFYPGRGLVVCDALCVSPGQ